MLHAISVDRNELGWLEPAMLKGPGCHEETAGPRHLPSMPRMKKQSAHAGLVVGVPLAPSLAHEI